MAFENWLAQFLNLEKTQGQSLASLKKALWLDSTYSLLGALGNPQDAFPSIHIAGSKGKGSVAIMTASVLSAAGYQTALYSSPHLVDIRERVALVKSGEQVFFPDEVYEASADILVAAVEKFSMADLERAGRSFTWFELVTAWAFLCFKTAKVSAAVIEVGLGGALDATNVIKPRVSVITPIELEHTQFLGNTIEKIATQKAGIIKPRTPVVVAFQASPEAARVIKKVAKEKGAPCTFFKKEYKAAPLRLKGAHQRKNAYIAAMAAKAFNREIKPDAINAGLSKAFISARFDERDFIAKSGEKVLLILDGFHTPNSAKSFVATLRETHPECAKTASLLYSSAADKNITEIAKILAPIFSIVVITKLPNTKACHPADIKKAFDSAGAKTLLCENLEAAFDIAIAKSKAVPLSTKIKNAKTAQKAEREQIEQMRQAKQTEKMGQTKQAEQTGQMEKAEQTEQAKPAPYKKFLAVGGSFYLAAKILEKVERKK